MTETTATGGVARLVVKRDRVRLLAWVTGIALLVVVTATSTKGIYDTQAKLDAAAAVAVDNPAALAFNGPAQALDTIGGQIAFQIGAFGLLIIALMSLLMTGRLTRGEEDSGRLEMVRAMPVGRRAPLLAGLIVVLALDVVVGLIVTATLLALGLEAGGSIVLGASYIAFGWLFVAITALFAQVWENPRVVGGAAGGVLGLMFALRAIGDAGDGSLSWLSPMGWAQKAKPYAGESWIPIVMLIALAGGLLWIAFVLSERRDFGGGMVAPRPGPPVGAPSLGTPVGLASRLHRGAAFWWCISVVAFGGVYGVLASAIDEFIVDNEALTDIIASLGEGSLTDSYLATSLAIISLTAAGPGLQIATRLRTEETQLRAEPILATQVPRRAWMSSHVSAALAVSAAAVVLGGLGLGVGYALSGAGAGEVPRLVVASLAYVPAVWLVTATSVALFGLAPRWTAGGWVVLGWCFVVAMFGALLDVPSWLVDVSPFEHTPGLPAEPLEVLPLLVLMVVTAALLAIGFTSFRGRDTMTS
jgi:ABC-2 type transport system permease protein